MNGITREAEQWNERENREGEHGNERENREAEQWNERENREGDYALLVSYSCEFVFIRGSLSSERRPMGINESNVLYPELSYRIVGLAMEVHNKLGYGFLEKVYENALMILFRREKIHAEQQMGIKVHFEDIVVGTYTADIVVDGKIIVELKAQPRLTQDHRAQTLNYLKATGLRLAIILNFGRHALESERLVM